MKITDRKQLAALTQDSVVVDANGVYFQLSLAYPPHKPGEWSWWGFCSEYDFTQKDIAMPAWTVGKQP